MVKKLDKKYFSLRTLTNIKSLHIEYYIYIYSGQEFIYYVIKKLKILYMDVLTFLDLIKEMLCLLHITKSPIHKLCQNIKRHTDGN